MQKTDSRPISPLFYLSIALVTLFAIATFFIARASSTSNFSASVGGPVAGLMHLKAMEKVSMPYEEAIANGKPTFLEFYADWCTSCQAMATTVEGLHERYGEGVNFVLMDIDEPALAKRVAEYGVTGVPHFIALTPEHQVVKSIVGRVPGGVLRQTFETLLGESPLDIAKSDKADTAKI